MRRTLTMLVTLGLLLVGVVPAYSKSADEANRDGEAAMKVGDFNAAIADFSEAIRLDPKNAMAYCNRGLAYARNGDGCEKAIADCSEAIRLDPKLALAYSNRGLVCSGKPDCEKALADCSEAIRIDPKCALAYSNRSAVYGAKREFDKALADSNEAIRLDPRSASALHSRGEVYLFTDKVNKAIADYTEAIRIDPKCVDAYMDRASAYSRTRKWDKVLADAAEAVHLAPKMAMAHNHMGTAYDLCANVMLMSDAKAANGVFDRAATYFDGPPKKLDEEPEQLPFDGSLDHFRAAAKKLDRSHKTQLLFDYSGTCFKTAIEIRPHYDFGNNNLGVYYARLHGAEDPKLAERYFRAALESNPRYTDAYNNLGIVLARQGRLDEAIAAYKGCLALRDNRASDHNNLSRAYFAKGELDNSLEENSAAIKCDPNFLSAWVGREEIYLKRDDLKGAAECVDRIAAIEPKTRDAVRAQWLYAGKCLDLNRPDDAIALLDRYLKSEKDAPELYYARGQAYLHKDDLRRAKQDFEQVLRLRPKFAEAQKELDAIRAKLGDAAAANDAGKAAGKHSKGK